MASIPASPAAERASRRRYRPPIGVPRSPSRPWGLAVSLALHLALLILLVTPALARHTLALVTTGAGGPGAAGGGGGGPRLGARGGARAQEVHFAAFAPPPSIAAAVPTPTLRRPQLALVKPVVHPTPRPTVTPIDPATRAPEPQIAAPALRAPSVELPVQVAGAAPGAALPGDGSAGNGPGTGGGTGTGVGPGRGSGEGPGTGGGAGTIYPATPEFLVMPALPVPKRVQGRTLELRFTIDEKGTITKVEFASSGDSGYDRELRERLSEYRFRPAHRADGTPVPSVYITRLTL